MENIAYKDSVFRYLFKESKNFVDLYKGLTGYELDKDSIKFYDLSTVFADKQLKNDISYMTKNKTLIIMAEHQGSINRNMPLRNLIYYADLIKLFINENRLNVFGTKEIEVPKAEIYVVYNGERELPDDMQIVFDGGAIRAEIITSDINYQKLTNKEERNSFTGYAYFMEAVRKHRNEVGLSMRQVIEKAKQDCIANGYLVEYMNRKEFVTMAAVVLTIEEEKRMMYEEGIEKGMEKGIEKGISEGIEKITKRALSQGMSVDVIEKLTGLNYDEIRKIAIDNNLAAFNDERANMEQENDSDNA